MSVPWLKTTIHPEHQPVIHTQWKRSHLNPDRSWHGISVSLFRRWLAHWYLKPNLGVQNQVHAVWGILDQLEIFYHRIVSSFNSLANCQPDKLKVRCQLRSHVSFVFLILPTQKIFKKCLRGMDGGSRSSVKYATIQYTYHFSAWQLVRCVGYTPTSLHQQHPTFGVQ